MLWNWKQGKVWSSSSPYPKGRILQSRKLKECETAKVRPSKRSDIICRKSASKYIKTASCHIMTHHAAGRECLKKEGRCLIFLRKSHLAKDCASKITCFKCSGRHHVSLCKRETQTNGNAIASRRDGAPQNTGLDLIGHCKQAHYTWCCTIQSYFKLPRRRLEIEKQTGMEWELEWFSILGAQRATLLSVHVTN